MNRRVVRVNDSRRYFDWIDYAGDDIEAARLLMTTDRCDEAAAFHCQQAIEKALKAYLLFITGNHVDGHNLTWLCRSALRYNQKFTEWLDDSAYLNRYYIETRYPSDIPLLLTRSDVDRIFKMANAMYEFIIGLIGK